MGRTVPTFRQLVEDAMQRWTKFRRALRREDQGHFDCLFRRARRYTQAATYQCNDNPMEAILLSIALDQEKRIHELEQMLLTKVNPHANPRMDLRPLPLPAGDEAVADRTESETPPTD